MDLEPVVLEIDWDEYVQPLRSAARRDHVSLSNSPGKVWYAIEVEDIPVAVAFVQVARGRGRIGGIYVKPDHRGRGYGEQLTAACIRAVRDAFCGVADCYALNPQYWVGLGFEQVGTNAHGYAHMRKLL